MQVLFLGDSITDQWRYAGKTVWDESFAPLGAINMGIDAATCQTVLNLLNGLECEPPRVVVLLIGTNHCGHTAGIMSGVQDVLEKIKSKWPLAKVLLLATFPVVWADRRAGNDAANAQLAKIEGVRFRDIGPSLGRPDNPDVFPDGLHLSENGYRIWAEAMKPTLLEMLKE